MEDPLLSPNLEVAETFADALIGQPGGIYLTELRELRKVVSRSKICLMKCLQLESV